MFSIGEKVVCIKAFTIRESSYNLGERHPTKGLMYTIRTISADKEGCFLRFEELINPQIQYSDCYGEGKFNSDNFRPLDHSFAEEVVSEIMRAPCEIPEGIEV